MQGQPWYAWEWLYDLLIARIHQAMGLNGVVFFTALVIAGTFAFALRLTLARGGNLPLTLTLLALALGASAIHLFARPHVLSWLLVVIWFERLDSWDRAVDRASDRALFWLPVLMLVWVNLHGGFLTGFILLGLYFAGNFLRSLTAPESAERQVAGQRLRLLGMITLLSLVATLANPYGYKLHVHIFEYLSNRFLMNHIEEFLSPNFHGLAEQCFALLLGITMIALAAEREKPRPSLLLVILFAAGSGLYASRNLPVSSLLLAARGDADSVAGGGRGGDPRRTGILAAPLVFALRVVRFANDQDGAVPARACLAGPGGGLGARNLRARRTAGIVADSGRAFLPPAVSRAGDRRDRAARPSGADLLPRLLGRISDLPPLSANPGGAR